MLYLTNDIYITPMQAYDPVTVRQVSRTDPVKPILKNTSRYATDVDEIRAADPAFKGEPGSLVDVFA